MDISNRIREIRADKTREQFSQVTGIHPQTLYKYENKTGKVSLEAVEIICKKFNICYEWLVTGTGPMRRDDELQPATALNQPPQAPPEAAEQYPACPRCAKLEKRLEASEEERREITQENRKLWQEIATIREQLARMDEYQKMRKHMQDGTTDSYVA